MRLNRSDLADKVGVRSTGWNMNIFVKTSVISVVDHDAIGRTQIGPYQAKIPWIGPITVIIANHNSDF